MNIRGIEKSGADSVFFRPVRGGGGQQVRRLFAVQFKKTEVDIRDGVGLRGFAVVNKGRVQMQRGEGQPPQRAVGRIGRLDHQQAPDGPLVQAQG